MISQGRTIFYGCVVRMLQGVYDSDILSGAVSLSSRGEYPITGMGKNGKRLNLAVLKCKTALFGKPPKGIFIFG